MDLDKKSWHKRFISWIYHDNTGMTDASNLCAYFWLCVMTFALLPLFLLVKFVMVMIDIVNGTSFANNEKIKNYAQQFFIAFGVVGWFLLGIYIGWHEILFITGLFAGGIGLIIIGALGAMSMKERYDEKHEGRKRTPNIVIEWIKAKKGKHCPRIEWHD